ncbi:cupin domain-containing protein [Vallicoccus soli]|uniref:Cupin domain-containing protein n=1 Tax=Vallicoccus soli TaxID=2339232 RepID=A0A3A3Z8V4_9ACTN|nr:cupin domain-containing protein [Vallicoccus soli]RJK97496.1 cupin domain-containing protein [Vallicoccus soli]
MSFFLPPHPYPPARHEGPPAASARWRRAGGPPDVVSRTGSCDHLATGATTRGDYGLYRWDMGPEPSGPSPHVHRTISEAFFVLSGVVRLHDGTGWADARPGDFVHVPEGGVHGFRNESGEPASMLILFSPGAPRERYFEGLAHLSLGGERPSDEEMAEFYARHDTWWVGD